MLCSKRGSQVFLHRKRNIARGTVRGRQTRGNRRKASSASSGAWPVQPLNQCQWKSQGENWRVTSLCILVGAGILGSRPRRIPAMYRDQTLARAFSGWMIGSFPARQARLNVPSTRGCLMTVSFQSLWAFTIHDGKRKIEIKFKASKSWSGWEKPNSGKASLLFCW